FHYSSGWEGIGVGAMVDGRFVFALAHQGKMFTVAVCRDLQLPAELRALKAELQSKREHAKENQHWFIKGEPWYQDVWMYPKYSIFFRNDGDWGTEGIRLPLVDGREQPDQPFAPGEWWWFQRHYNDKGKDETAVFGNHGNMVIEAAGEDGGVKITRNVWDSHHQKFENDPWVCAGMWLEPGVLLLGMGGDESSGVGYYEIDGKTLKGKICDVDGLHPYAQTVTVPDDVASRNTGLFH
ncbi:MAG TPA: hypothetical protein VFD83_04860, partial [Candidatus Polarisedimenticolia bacterium]|nr:hypothetical protein [Candidatus Polarisedimenticolia bacterium]